MGRRYRPARRLSFVRMPRPPSTTSTGRTASKTGAGSTTSRQSSVSAGTIPSLAHEFSLPDADSRNPASVVRLVEQQRAGGWMSGIRKDFTGNAFFHHDSFGQHRHAIREIACEVHVVGRDQEAAAL